MKCEYTKEFLALDKIATKGVTVDKEKLIKFITEITDGEGIWNCNHCIEKDDLLDECSGKCVESIIKYLQNID